jgi:hypothetical protein
MFPSTTSITTYNNLKIVTNFLIVQNEIDVEGDDAQPMAILTFFLLLFEEDASGFFFMTGWCY